MSHLVYSSKQCDRKNDKVDTTLSSVIIETKRLRMKEESVDNDI